MLEILSYTFFQNALVGGIIISIISGILGVFIIMRKEANITHSISNFLFFGIAISLLFNSNYYLFAFLFAIIGSIILFLLERTNLITKESTKEIISEGGLAAGIFAIGFLGNLTLDINNFLFGSILFINRFDIIILSILLLVILLLFFLYRKNLISIIINEDIAKSKGLRVNVYNLCFLIILSIFIAISVKIFGIMLVGAFLILPGNISKLNSRNLRGVFLNAIIISCLSVVFGLFLSYFIGTNSGATIVLLLVIIFFFCFIVKSGRK